MTERGDRLLMRRKWLMILFGVVLLALAGCSSDQLSDEEAESLLNEISLMALENGNIKEIEKKIDENIDKLKKEQASDAVNALLYAIHMKIPDFSSKMSGMQDAIYKYEDKGIDFNDPASFSQIEDATLKAFLQELHDNYFLVHEEAGVYLANPNVSYVLNKYRSYMNEDLLAWTEFVSNEYEESVFDEDKQQFKLDLLVKRIIELEDNIKRFSDSNFLSGFENAKNYYYQVYFGVNHEFFVDGDQKVLDEVIQHYKQTIEQYPDSQLSKDLKLYVEKLESEGNKMTDDIYAFLADLTKAETIASVEPTQNDIQSKSQIDSSLKEAIKEAIRENAQ